MSNVTDHLEGFTALMMGTNSNTEAAISGHVDLEKHPIFGSQTPDSDPVTYIGSSMCEAEVEGVIRIIGWKLANINLGFCPREVSFLRKFESGWFNQQQSYFYEIGISNQPAHAGSEIFMVGEEMYEHSPNHNYRRKLDAVWEFLGYLHNIPVECVKMAYEDAHQVHNFVLAEKGRQTPKRQAEEAKRRELEKTWVHFRKEQKVVWSTAAFHTALPVMPRKSDVMEILGLEIVPRYCSCGLGKRANIRFHPEQRCNLGRRHAANHHQILTVKVGNACRQFSGHYLLPLEAL